MPPFGVDALALAVLRRRRPRPCMPRAQVPPPQVVRVVWPGSRTGSARARLWVASRGQRQLDVEGVRPGRPVGMQSLESV